MNNKRLRRWGLTAACCLAVGTAAGTIAVASFAPDSAGSLPSFDAVRAAHQPSDLLVMDRHGEAIAALRMDYAERRGAWIRLSAVSPALQKAVLLSEDRRFYEHGGVDWLAAVAAGWAWIWGQGARGASTISMQLAAILDHSLQRPGGGRNLSQKLDQAKQARQLEAVWTKEQILEAYLNLVAFRGELRGVEAVSRVMYGRHPHGLQEREAAVAAALLRGPNASVETVSGRACALLKESEAPDCAGLQDAVRQWFAATARPAVDTPSLAPHFARVVAARQDIRHGGRLRTTLDARLQRKALQSMQRHLAGMGHTQLTDAAVVVLDNASGEVLAYVGSSGVVSAAGEVDHARARRQAGSTLKPFLYAQALGLRYLTAASLLDDSALDVATAAGLYMPQNYDRSHAGLVSVRTALASSLNIPAVRALMLVGPERFADQLRSLGLPLEHEGDHYGYSLSLGSADIDLLSLTNAYRTLANQGRWQPPVMALNASPSSGMRAPVAQAIDPSASWIIGDILSDRQARARTFGLENALATRFWSAVKTGTSKDMRDNWTLGWSERYTVGVWVGNSAGLSMREVSGVSGAAPIWHDLLSYLHEGRPSSPPDPPSALLRQPVVFDNDIEAPRHEYFLPGAVVTRVAPVSGGSVAELRINSPVAGTIIALDPDMPEQNQRLILQASPLRNGQEKVSWRIGSTVITHGSPAYWRPRPGRHHIILQDEHEKELDRVEVWVRGLPRIAQRD